MRVRVVGQYLGWFATARAAIPAPAAEPTPADYPELSQSGQAVPPVVQPLHFAEGVEAHQVGVTWRVVPGVDVPVQALGVFGLSYHRIFCDETTGGGVVVPGPLVIEPRGAIDQLPRVLERLEPVAWYPTPYGT